MAISSRRLVYIVTLTKEGSDPIEVSCRGDYKTECGGCGESVNKSKEISLTAVQKTQLINFGTQVVLADIESGEEE